MDQNPWPDEIKENFAEKVDKTVEDLHNITLEFYAFAEAHDEGGEANEDT